MRTAVGYFACLTALASLAWATPEAQAPLPVYYLHDYYKLLDAVPTWQRSDAAPWQVVKDAPWIKPRLVKWGYVPIVHDDQPYYCLIDDAPATGSHIVERTFICGDPQTVEWLFNTNRNPSLRLYGATH